MKLHKELTQNIDIIVLQFCLNDLFLCPVFNTTQEEKICKICYVVWLPL